MFLVHKLLSGFHEGDDSYCAFGFHEKLGSQKDFGFHLSTGSYIVHGFQISTDSQLFFWVSCKYWFTKQDGVSYTHWLRDKKKKKAEFIPLSLQIRSHHYLPLNP